MFRSEARPRRLRWTRYQTRSLSRSGLSPVAEFELIDGEILPKIPRSETHGRMVVLLMRALVALFGWDFVRSQAPVAIGPYDEPEPDGAVTF